MPVNSNAILELVQQICEEKKLVVSVREVVKGGAIASVMTMLGGALISGPYGFIFGSLLGGIIAAYLSNGKFKSVASIIKNDLTDAQREKLANSVRSIVSEIDLVDIAKLTLFIMQPSIKGQIAEKVAEFLLSELKMHVTRN